MIHLHQKESLYETRLERLESYAVLQFVSFTLFKLPLASPSISAMLKNAQKSSAMLWNQSILAEHINNAKQC